MHSVLKHAFMLMLYFGCSAGCGQSAVADGGLNAAEHDYHSKKTKRSGDYFARKRFEALRELVRRLAGRNEREKLAGVNDFFNRVPFMSDKETWGVEDYWARPSEFLTRDQGDCEDFVIAKFFTLKELGVDETKLYFTYVKALKLNQAHMVLTYYKTPKSVPLVLDNINYRILPATERNDLAYVYSFNAASLFLNTPRGRGRTVEGAGTKNKQWAAFLDRIEKDGL